MKTKLKLFTLIFALLCLAVLVMPNNVLAAGELVEVDTYEELRTELENGNSVKLTDNIKVTGKTVVKSGRSVGIAVMATNDVVLDGNGFSISGDNQNVEKIMEIYAGETPANVTFKNVTITNEYDGGRAIDTRTGNLTFNLVNSTLKAVTQGLTVGGPTGPVNVNVDNSNIEAKYGVITFNPVKMTIQNNSTISGYAAIYMKAATSSLGSNGSTVTVDKSNLASTNNNNGETNNCATVILEDCGIEFNVQGSKISATGNGTSLQDIFSESVNVGDEYKKSGVSFATYNTINITGNTTIDVKSNIVNPLINDTNVDDTKVTLNKGVTSNVEIPAEFLPSGMMAKKVNGSYVVSEIEVDFNVSQDKEENDKDFVVEAVQSETTKETLNSSLKADTELFVKAEEAIKNGEEVNVEIKVEELEQDTVKTEEKEKITAVVSKDGKVHQYFDISVLVMANNAEIGKLSELTEKVKLSMKLPKDLVKEGRKFYILKLHNGNVEKIEANVNGENLEFETNEFSLYALAYEDAPASNVKDETPKMGTINVSYVWFALATIAVVGIATTKKASKHSK